MPFVMNNFPDPGAEITVRTHSGKEHTGTLIESHAFVDKENTLCLAVPPRGGSVDLDNPGECLYHFVDVPTIESWSWDCRP